MTPRARQPDLFESKGKHSTLAELEAKVQSAREKSREKAIVELPAGDTPAETADPNNPFFLLHIVDCSFKDDVESMGSPFYSLSTKPDRETFRWTSANGQKSIEVRSGELGRATMHDKDLMIFALSRLVAAVKQGIKVDRTIRFTAHDFFVTTQRGTAGDDYDRLRKTLIRLRETTIVFDDQRKKVNGKIQKPGIFKIDGLIDNGELVENMDGRTSYVEVTLSKWFFDVAKQLKVLTINGNAYFALRQPLAKRLYEIARQHCGSKGAWSTDVNWLHIESGSSSPRRNFRIALREVIKEDLIPDYRYSIGDDDTVTITNRKPAPEKVTFLSPSLRRRKKPLEAPE